MTVGTFVGTLCIYSQMFRHATCSSSFTIKGAILDNWIVPKCSDTQCCERLGLSSVLLDCRGGDARKKCELGGEQTYAENTHVTSSLLV